MNPQLIDNKFVAVLLVMRVKLVIRNPVVIATVLPLVVFVVGLLLRLVLVPAMAMLMIMISMFNAVLVFPMMTN